MLITSFLFNFLEICDEIFFYLLELLLDRFILLLFLSNSIRKYVVDPIFIKELKMIKV